MEGEICSTFDRRSPPATLAAQFKVDVCLEEVEEE